MWNNSDLSYLLFADPKLKEKVKELEKKIPGSESLHIVFCSQGIGGIVD